MTVEQERCKTQAPASALAADAPLEERLTSWFDCFCKGSAQWGLVDYWRADGTSYKRHGMIVTLCVDLVQRLKDEKLGLRKLREAINLVQLVLAVQPSAIRSVLEKMKKDYCWLHPRYVMKKLDVIARGVPVELRLHLDVGKASLGLLKTIETIRAFDWKLSTDEAFLAVRQELMACVESDKSKLVQLNYRTVRAVLDARLHHSDDPSEATSTVFLENLTAFSEAQHNYQRERGAIAATMATRHVVFEVTKITLDFYHDFLSSRVVESAMKLLAAGLPVHWSPLQLDLRLVDCSENQLRTFLGAVAQQPTRLCIGTIRQSTQNAWLETVTCIDENGEDHRERIGMLLRAVGSIRDNVSALNVGGLLKLCEEHHNRGAVWRGLFESVLVPGSRVERLLLTDAVVLREDDATWIDQCASERRALHPDKKLRVKCLTLNLKQSNFAALRALLFAFDDIEEVSLSHPTSFHESPLPRDLCGSLLGFPSLRKLSVSNIAVPTMEIFDPTIVDESLPMKPVLEELALDGIVLEDVASLQRFFRSLNPLESTSPLIATLRKLRVTQRDCDALNPRDFYDSSTMAALNDMLQSNRVIRSVTVTDVIDDAEDMSLHEQKKKLSTQDGRYLPAPLDDRKSALASACKAAFVSAICANTSDCTSARRRLDTSFLRQIFDFIAPGVRRTIRKRPLDREDL